MTKLKRQLSCKLVMFGGSTKPVHAGSKSFTNMTLFEGTSEKKNELLRFKSYIISIIKYENAVGIQRRKFKKIKSTNRGLPYGSPCAFFQMLCECLVDKCGQKRFHFQKNLRNYSTQELT